MIKDSTNKKRCPACSAENSYINVRNIVSNPKDYTVSSFCAECSYHAKHNSYCRTSHHYSLSDSSIAQASNRYEEVFKILVSLGAVTNMYRDHYYRAFGNLIGMYEDKAHRDYALELPLYNTWNSVVGALKINENRCTVSSKKAAQVMLLSKHYNTDLLVITENPIDALAIRYASIERYSQGAAVLIPLPEKKAPLKLFCNPRKILAYCETPSVRAHVIPQLEQYLMENPARDAILIDRNIRAVPGNISAEIRDDLKKGKRLNAKRRNTTINIDSRPAS